MWSLPPAVHGYVRLPKNMAVTSSELMKALDNKCMFDGSAIDGFAKIESLDPVSVSGFKYA